MNLAELRARGFDESYSKPFTRQYILRCRHCEPVAVQGTPTHEAGCPNAKHECEGCNELVPSIQRYCTDCAP